MQVRAAKVSVDRWRRARAVEDSELLRVAH